MFDFLKPKVRVIQVGFAYADTFKRIMDNKEPEIQTEIQALLLAGADPDRIRAEFAAFYLFQHYFGINVALVAGRFTQKQASEIRDAFAQGLEQGAACFDLSDVSTVTYSSVSEWLAARMGQYQFALESVMPHEAAKVLVSQFCDFAFIGEPSEEVKLILEAKYKAVSTRAYKRIVETRFA